MQLDDHWAHVHPQLDPEDDNDPMQRSNAVLLLQDPATRAAAAARHCRWPARRAPGPVTWRDIAVLNGTHRAGAGQGEDDRGGDLGRVRRDRPGAAAAARDGGGQRCWRTLPAISAAFDREAGAGSGPDYDDLIKLLRDIQREMNRYRGAAREAPRRAEAEAEAAATARGRRRRRARDGPRRAASPASRRSPR